MGKSEKKKPSCHGHLEREREEEEGQMPQWSREKSWSKAAETDACRHDQRNRREEETEAAKKKRKLIKN